MKKIVVGSLLALGLFASALNFVGESQAEFIPPNLSPGIHTDEFVPPNL